jgi:hypothetical protein
VFHSFGAMLFRVPVARLTKALSHSLHIGEKLIPEDIVMHAGRCGLFHPRTLGPPLNQDGGVLEKDRSDLIVWLGTNAIGCNIQRLASSSDRD